jgi:hypothetical protein
VVVVKQRTRNLGPSRLDIDRAMTEPKPLTYNEQKAAEAAFTGAPSNPDWTEAARLLYLRLSSAMTARRDRRSDFDSAAIGADRSETRR